MGSFYIKQIINTSQLGKERGGWWGGEGFEFQTKKILKFIFIVKKTDAVGRDKNLIKP